VSKQNNGEVANEGDGMNGANKLGPLREGAKNLVAEYACVRAGEKVCVYADTACDPLVTEAIAEAARNAGGSVVVVIADEVQDPEESGLVDPPAVAVNAFFAADVVLSILSVFKMQWSAPSLTKALKEYGVRLAYIGPNTAGELARKWARFPADVSLAMGRKTLAQLREGGAEITVTDGRGTELTVRVDPKKWGGAGTRGPMKEKGAYGVIPASTIGTNKIETAGGRVVLDFLEAFGPSAETCELVVRDGWVTDIRGGARIEAFREKVFGMRNANLFSQISWGFNPGGRVEEYLAPPWDKNKMSVLTRLAGVIHFGLGATSFHQGGETSVSGAFHTHGVHLKPTVRAGKTLIIDGGRLTVLDDPEVRAAAAKYGDPDEVLGP